MVEPCEAVFSDTGELLLSKDSNNYAKITLHNEFLAKADADRLFIGLQSDVPWFQHEDRYGLQPRLTCWYGPYPYAYSGLTHPVKLEWHPLLQELRDRLEAITNHAFNSVLCNLYRDHKDCVDWHSDDEPSLGKNPYIASLSLGAIRPFQMRKKMNDISGNRSQFTVHLNHGSLLIMEGSTQDDWQHRLPSVEDQRGPRINLTFRTIFKNEF